MWTNMWNRMFLHWSTARIIGLLLPHLYPTTIQLSTTIQPLHVYSFSHPKYANPKATRKNRSYPILLGYQTAA